MSPIFNSLSGEPVFEIKMNFSSVTDNNKLDFGTRLSSLIVIPITFLQCLVGSSLIIVALLTDKKLFNRSNFVVGFLVVPDIIFLSVASPILFWTHLTSKWEFGILGCKIYMYSSCTCFASSVAHQMCISMQKYMIIVQDSRILITRTANVVSVFVCWFIAISLLIPTFVNEVTGQEDIDVGLDCLFYPGLGHIQMYIYCFYTVIPCGVMSFCYGSIFRMNSKVSRNVIKRQTGDASLTHARKQFKKRQVSLARTTAVCSLVNLLGYAPFAFLKALDLSGHLHRGWYMLFTFFYCAATGSNAMIYGLLHRTFRVAYMKSVYKCMPCCKCLKPQTGSLDFRHPSKQATANTTVRGISYKTTQSETGSGETQSINS